MARAVEKGLKEKKNMDYDDRNGDEHRGSQQRKK